MHLVPLPALFIALAKIHHLPKHPLASLETETINTPDLRQIVKDIRCVRQPAEVRTQRMFSTNNYNFCPPEPHRQSEARTPPSPVLTRIRVHTFMPSLARGCCSFLPPHSPHSSLLASSHSLPPTTSTAWAPAAASRRQFQALGWTLGQLRECPVQPGTEVLLYLRLACSPGQGSAGGQSIADECCRVVGVGRQLRESVEWQGT